MEADNDDITVLFNPLAFPAFLVCLPRSQNTKKRIQEGMDNDSECCFSTGHLSFNI